MLDQLINYILYQLRNRQAAKHLMTGIESVYVRLRNNPFQFPECEDYVLRRRKYKKALIPDMKYILIFRIDEIEKKVYIVGFFHSLEDYGTKIKSSEMIR